MPDDIESYNGRSLERSVARLPMRELRGLERRTYMRRARVQAEGIVQTEKLREIDHLTQTAMTGHALLSKWRDTLCNSDPLLHEDITFLVNVSRLGKADILVDSINTMHNL